MAKYRRPLVLVASIILSLVIGGIIILLIGEDPLEAYGALLSGSLGSFRQFAQTLSRMTVLTLAGLATAVAFKTGIYNIGAEGQLYLGAFAATYVGLTFTGLPAPIHIALATLFAAAAGAIWAYVPGVLRVKYRMDEVVTTIMLTSVAILFTDYLVNYPFIAEEGKLGATNVILETAQFPRLVELTRFNSSFFVMIAIALVIGYIMTRTTMGYNLRMSGQNPLFARFGGLDPGKQMIYAMLISGAMAGIGGGFQVLGVHYRFHQQISPGYGFDGILLALMVNHNPYGVILMGFFFAVLRTGSLSMEQATAVPSELILVIQAIIILFVAGERGFGKLLFKEKGGAAGA